MAPSSLLDDRSLPSLGLDISRPSSAASTVGSGIGNGLQRQSSFGSVQLPALSTLANVAERRGEKRSREGSEDGSDGRGSAKKASPTPSLPQQFHGHTMTYATAAPATSGGQPNAPPVCQNCATSTTPLWRRDESGSVLCNACGLFLKLHGRPRPISLKTDVIKSRNRVKTGVPGGRKKAPDAIGLPAAHPDTDHSLGLIQHRRASGKLSSGLSDRSQSPISRTGTPNMHHPSNIAPQHMFESALHHDFHSPSLPGFALRQPSPSATSSINGSHLEPPMSYDALSAQNTSLRTRVSELEVINNLFRERVTELETSEQDARRTEMSVRESEAQLRLELDEIRAREADLKRRLEELENDGPRHKKMRLSDIVDDSRSGTPVSVLGD